MCAAAPDQLGLVHRNVSHGLNLLYREGLLAGGLRLLRVGISHLPAARQDVVAQRRLRRQAE
jgi:hypothetical protein